MKELPNNRLTMKEIWIEGEYLSTLSKEEKKKYKAFSILEKRQALNNYKLRKDSNTNDEQDNYESINKTLKKHGLTNVTESTKDLIQVNNIGQFIDSFFSRLSSTAMNPKDSDTIFTYEQINQNFALIKLLDDLIKDNQALKEQNTTLINQNQQIIALLHKIADK
ncbi:hypothetical protein [Staphylococcus warneri]|uniref:hypothetical protein n=1 Tax=Staphylococcus warneri TaxID=1292 RepID=UPI0002AD627D|nr:hypothetical protein [Staphylococcus warneri]AGC91584.1 hypothetical protein A284_11355 [Staphylococcus warneri SG1]KEK50594.1 hypothetical protein AQ02_0061 [Staphylococcus warneri Lyso 1 2011]KEK57504.1 hypothetical protein AQ03_0060 [Staphylococcus warneri Lyso 2 2011]MCE5012890.1 hypothetical protein [Staphylococcus warneri]MCM3052637.1 hypothetical protein [Staphylococcus warneri]